MTRPAIILAAAALAAGCASPPPAPYDYGPYLDHMPKSILVLPPLDETHEVGAGYSFLSTVTRPLAEHGYYVFPVAVVDEFMKAEGCPTPTEMRLAPLDKLGLAFGADAVLYLTVMKWGTSYQLLNSQTSVAVSGRLVDIRTGTQIWSGGAAITRNSNDGGGGGRDAGAILVGMLVKAVVNQIVASATDPSHDLAPAVSHGLVYNDHHGLLPGPRDAHFDEDQRRRRAPPVEPSTTTDAGKP